MTLGDTQSKNEKYCKITKKDLPNIFEIINNNIYLKNSKALPFKIDFPLKLDESLAKISAMILDGCLTKNLNSCIFSQKKDKIKTIEFFDIIKNLFNISGKFSTHKPTKTAIVTYSRKAFVSFLYYCLNIHKSDESARIPKWIWVSPKLVVKEYLRYAFAMEGSIKHYLKASEIRFHSVDFEYIIDLKKILKDKFDITSKIYRYYIKNYGWKYYLYFCDKNNIIKFNNIGFALKSHQRRLEKLILSFHNMAWEITLVKLLELRKNYFTLRNVHKIFRYLCKRAVHQRLCELIRRKYLHKEECEYSFTEAGYRTAQYLRSNVRITKLRTYPIENECNIVEFLNQNGKSYRNEIAQNLKINVSTVRNTLRRLVKHNKIRYLEQDKFQRKFYEIIT